MSSPVPLTELEAVNELLKIIGESPVNALEDTEVADASLALSTLRTTSVEVQTPGWWFNSEDNVTVEPDTDKFIRIPAEVLSVDTSGSSSGTNAVHRGTRLYDRSTRSYEFDASVTVDWIVALAFEELPSSARNYVAIKAARRFQARFLGDRDLHQFTEADEYTARVALMDEHLQSSDANMLNDSQFISDLRSRA